MLLNEFVMTIHESILKGHTFMMHSADLSFAFWRHNGLPDSSKRSLSPSMSIPKHGLLQDSP